MLLPQEHYKPLHNMIVTGTTNFSLPELLRIQNIYSHIQRLYGQQNLFNFFFLGNCFSQTPHVLVLAFVAVRESAYSAFLEGSGDISKYSKSCLCAQRFLKKGSCGAHPSASVHKLISLSVTQAAAE